MDQDTLKSGSSRFLQVYCYLFHSRHPEMHRRKWNAEGEYLMKTKLQAWTRTTISFKFLGYQMLGIQIIVTFFRRSVFSAHFGQKSNLSSSFGAFTQTFCLWGCGFVKSLVISFYEKDGQRKTTVRRCIVEAMYLEFWKTSKTCGT